MIVSYALWFNKSCQTIIINNSKKNNLNWADPFEES